MTPLRLSPLLLLLACPPTDDKGADDTGPPTGEGEGEGETDVDGDGYGEDDCDDGDPGVFPGAAETCDGRDEDCDGDIDEDAAGNATWYADDDGDGWGDPDDSTTDCEIHDGMVLNGEDCDDNNPYVYPDADELCDQEDNDCDEEVDEDVGTYTFYADADGDGFGDASEAVEACDVPDGYTADDTDCDDDDADINPDAMEACDERDNDCDEEVDESGGTTWYQDADGDGWGDLLTSTESCDALSGWVAVGGDCDDADDGVNPGATERPCSGTDEDCDGEDETGAVFVSATGAGTDLSDALGAGSATDPVAYTLSTNGTLTFCEGTWYVALTVEASTLEINSLDGAESTILNGAGSTVLTIGDDASDVTVSGLTLTGGSGESGGAIASTSRGVDLFIEDSLLVDNTASKEGGAVYMAYGTLSVSGSTLSGNVAEEDGGAIYLGHATGIIEDSVLSDNVADEEGGAVRAGSSSTSGDTVLSVSGSSFTGNTATSGGAILAYLGGVEMKGCEISGNSATSGGGLYAYYSSNTLTTTSIYENTATYGGGIFLSLGSVTLSCDGEGGVWSNGTGNSGGGVYVQYTGSVTSESCDFGEDSTDNSTYDVVMPAVRVSTSDYGSSASFVCSVGAGGCSD